MADRLIAREDEDVSAGVKAILEKRRHRGPPERRMHRLREARGTASPCGSSCGEGPKEIVGSHVLFAVGRRPEHRRPRPRQGRRQDRRARLHRRRRRSSAPMSPASSRVGDATAAAPSPTPPTTTTRSWSPTCSTASIARVSDRITAYGLFIDPPLGRVGMTEREVRQSGRKALMATMQMTRVGRARERSETDGFMKILVDARERSAFSARRSSASRATRRSSRC